MPKIATLVSKESAKLSTREKASIRAAKSLLAVMKSGDAAEVNAFCDIVASYSDVLNQRGAGEGKRFAGAASHAFEDQVTAFADTTIRGAVVKIG